MKSSKTPTKPKKTPKPKKRRTGITLVTRNGILVALTPADIRRQKGLAADKQSASNKVLTEPAKSRTVRQGSQRSKAMTRLLGIDLEASAGRAIKGLRHRNLFELRQMWLNLVVRMEKSRGGSELSTLIRFRDELVAEWSRRAEEALKNPDYFEWPSTEARNGDGSLAASLWPGEGMLSFLGYRVGVTQGLTEGSRRQILDLLFGSSLPPINGPNYMRDWSSPSSSSRLCKLAETLASLARNAKRKKATNMDSAIADWEHDLSYLYHEYYVGRFAFAWPRIDG